MKTKGKVEDNLAITSCPLTGMPFKEPVIDYEGNTYEKKAILEWLRTSQTSPITRNPLTENQLFPNRALQDLIDNNEEEEEEDESLPSTTVNSSILGDSSSSEDDENENEDNTKEMEFLSNLKESISIRPTYRKSDGIGLVKIQVPDDEDERHMSASIVCIIDESYSMNDPATTTEDREGASGLTLLDIVKHATKTIIETLGSNDQLAVIAYSDTARTVLPFSKMTLDNKKKASDAVDSIRPIAGTNLWDGLIKAMEMVNREPENENNKSSTDIFLLTDGVPNIHPPRGELETFRRYRKKQQATWNCRISTFGFGYNLDSQLLNDIAIEGDGQYCFIPDSSFVGTVFINATANVLSTAYSTSTVTLNVQDGPKIIESPSFDIEDLEDQTPDSNLSLSLPSLCFGQTINVLVNNDISAFQGCLEVDDHGSSVEVEIEIAKLRLGLVSMIRGAEARFRNSQNVLAALTQAQEDTKALIDKVNTVIDANKDASGDSLAILQSIKDDLTGQITEAYCRQDWHQKWGHHYLLSLARAHELQHCTNFKDSGLQVYATKKFSLIRDLAEDAFCKLPPPKPSGRIRNINYQPVASMSAYYNAAGGCLARGNVRLEDGRYIPVSQVKAGDSLLTCNGTVKVRCVVTTRCVNGVEELVELDGGVLLTPWHPVRVKGSSDWKFPVNLATPKYYSCDMVYNFVLEDNGKSSSIPIGPLEAISLGHGIKNDPVAKHEYFGTDKVIQDLSKMIGWDHGHVELGLNPARRNPKTGLITSFVQNKNIIHDGSSTTGPKRTISTDSVSSFGMSLAKQEMLVARKRTYQT